ncbi:cupin domain-containing protein [Nocardia nova]|uniref:Cupin domain-containing protein n=1 Tax=Nocardia nova SH22a TaxID=1415166 RepID=W5TE55_9NOCA|nr:cupin domain-containing protein [Nocardia nova]AHH17507.1 cupin domain-containing protein [Nocardia nova SH22a]
MAIRNRRVVTGLDAEGRSCIRSDESVADLTTPDPDRPLVWATALPADNRSDGEPAHSPVSLDLFSNGGGFLTVSEMRPGESGPMHATDTVDYVIVLDGSVRMAMEEGEVVLNPGDIVVQRGVAHSWTVVGDKPMTMACIVLPAEPVPGANDQYNIRNMTH